MNLNFRVARIRSVIAGAGLALACCAPASALPGQSIAAFFDWTRGTSVFHYFADHQRSGAEAPSYRGSGRDRGVKWSFWAVDDDGRVSEEILRLSLHGRPLPIRPSGGAGYAFLDRAFGERVATDFEHATALAVRGWRGPARFYRGARYGYGTSLSPGSNDLTIMTHAALDRAYGYETRCPAHPRTAECAAVN